MCRYQWRVGHGQTKHEFHEVELKCFAMKMSCWWPRKVLCLAERSGEGQHSRSLHQSHIRGEFPGSSHQLLSKHTAHPDGTCTLTLFVPKLISRLVAALQKDKSVQKKKKSPPKKICLLSSVVYLEFQVWELSWGTPARTVSVSWNLFFFFSL